MSTIFDQAEIATAKRGNPRRKSTWAASLTVADNAEPVELLRAYSYLVIREPLWAAGLITGIADKTPRDQRAAVLARL